VDAGPAEGPAAPGNVGEGTPAAPPSTAHSATGPTAPPLHPPLPILGYTLPSMATPMPALRRWTYALGATGYMLSDRLVVTVAIYFYLPPEGRGLATQVPDRVFLFALTAFGLANLAGRLVDMLVDPVVGWASDRSRSRLGRRRVFLLWGMVPMCLLPALLFWPPAEPGSVANAWWAGGLLSLYFFFFTVYVGPYLALIPEIAWTGEERVNLATLLAIVQIPAFLFAFGWGVGRDAGVAAGLDATDAVRWVAVGTSVLALALCALPVLAVDEGRFCRTVRSDLALRQAFVETLRNRPFRRYLVAQMPFIVGITMIQPATAYYATVILGRSEGYMAWLGGALFAMTLLAFGPVNRYARRAGPKRTIIACVATLCVSVSLLGLLAPGEPGSPRDAWNLALLFVGMGGAGISLAGFITMPHVLISQVIDYDTARTGHHRAAMYFGIQGFATKLLYGVGTALLAFLFSAFGNSAGEPLGVILVGPVAGALCLVSALLYLRYPEREVLSAAVAAQVDRDAGPRDGVAGPVAPPDRRRESSAPPCSPRDP